LQYAFFVHVGLFLVLRSIFPHSASTRDTSALVKFGFFSFTTAPFLFEKARKADIGGFGASGAVIISFLTDETFQGPSNRLFSSSWRSLS
jgi:hypothetical protein